MFNYEGKLNDEVLKESIELDYLKRNKNLVVLANLLISEDRNSMISIDGKWGSGKTFFVRQFKYLVENNNTTYNDIFTEKELYTFSSIQKSSLIVYYNAWENDSHRDALESLLYNILDEYPLMKDQVADFDSFKKMLKCFARDFLYSSTNGLLDINNFDKLKSFQDLANEIVTIEEKRIAFNNLIELILGDKKRLILIIDELDRCKPSYAIELLETLKHFYNNDKISIIVSTNNMELTNTIKAYYGLNFDGYAYLSKFYDYIISLDNANIKEYLKNKYNFGIKTWAYHDFSYLIMKYFDFTLRDCNRFITLYNLSKKYIESSEYDYRDRHYIHTCILVPIALALKIKNIYKYDSFVSGKEDSLIIGFLDSFVSDTNFEKWLKELSGVSPDSDYKMKVLDEYHDSFNDEYKYGKYPFFEAISMIGTDLLIDNGYKNKTEK